MFSLITQDITFINREGRDNMLDKDINWDIVTVEDCIEGNEKTKREYEINDGQIIGYTKEK